MKLRVKGNSLRLRLTQGEVARFAKTGLVEETVDFGFGQRFIYALSSSAGNHETARAVFKNNGITVYVPKTKADEWTRTNQVGIRAEQSLNDGNALQISVEKDFVCLEKRADGEDESDAYPHPANGRVD